MAKSSTAAKYRGMLEDAKKSASGRVKRVREKASKQEMVQAGAAVAGGAVHGWARASGYSEVGGLTWATSLEAWPWSRVRAWTWAWAGPWPWVSAPG